jgi:hypothetical protein
MMTLRRRDALSAEACLGAQFTPAPAQRGRGPGERGPARGFTTACP